MAAVILLAAPLFCEGTVEEVPAEPVFLEVDHRSNLRLTTFLGEDVWLDQRRVATVEDAMIDIGQGQAPFFVLRFVDDSIRDCHAYHARPYTARL